MADGTQSVDRVSPEPTMPTIDEDKALVAGEPAVSGGPSATTLSPPPSSGDVLSAKTSSNTLVTPQPAQQQQSQLADTASEGKEAVEVEEKARLPTPAPPPPAEPALKEKKSPFGLKSETKTQLKHFWGNDMQPLVIWRPLSPC